MMQSFAKDSNHRREPEFDEYEQPLYRPYKGFTAGQHNRSLFTKFDAVRNNGRLDLSFTKCNFPEDYLPYAGASKKRLDACDLTNYRSTGYDNLAFGSNAEFTVGSSHKANLSSPYGLQEAGPLPSSSKQSHIPSSGNQFTPPFTSSYNSLERGRRNLFSSSIGSYHDPFHRSSTGGALTLPLPLPSSPSTSSSSCLTTHHLHPSTRNARGCKLAKSCGCCVLVLIATLILVSLSLVVGFSLYLTIVTNFLSKTPLVYSISGSFKVVSGDNFNLRLLNQTSEDYIRKSARYENLLQHILDKSLIADSLLKSEVYSFRKGSLIVFFRMYAAKSKLDGLLDLHSKAIINLNTIENVYIEDSVVLGRLRDIVRSAFRASKSYLTQAHGDIVIDIDTVKIGHLDQMTEHYFRLDKQSLSHKESLSANTDANVNSHKWASFITDTETSADQDQQATNDVQSSPTTVDSGNPNRQLPPVLNTPTTTNPPATQSTTIAAQAASKRPTKAPTRKEEHIIDLKDNEHDGGRPENRRELVEGEKENKGTRLVPVSKEQATVKNSSHASNVSTATTATPLPPATKGEEQLEVINEDDKVNHPGGANLLIASSQEKNVIQTQQAKPNQTSGTIETKTEDLPSSKYLKSGANKHQIETKHEINEFSVLFDSNDNINISQSQPTKSQSTTEDLIKVEGREDDAETENPSTTTSNELEESTVKTTTPANVWDSLGEMATQPSKVKISSQPNNTSSWNESSLASSGHSVSVDGFAILLAETSDHNASNNSSIPQPVNVAHVPVPAIVKLDNKEGAAPTVNRVLIASEDSFDLYSLRNEKSNTTVYANPNGTIDTATNPAPHNEFMDGANQEDEFLLYSSSISQDGAGNSFGKRISKKLNSESSKVNSIDGYDLSKPGKVKEVGNVSIEHLNDINGPNLKGHPEFSTVTTVPPTTTTTTTISPCKVDEFHCAISGECISLEEKCDGKMVNCRDGTDESDCRCADKLRKDPASAHKICDGILDCEDRSDEHDELCSECQKPGMFLCRGHQSQCIEMSKVCNGEMDCLHGDDEHGCIALVSPTDLTGDNDKIGEHFNSGGILFIRHHGQWGPLCFDNYDVQINEVFPKSSVLQVEDMGQAVCKANYFTQLDSINLLPLPPKHNLSYYSISANISNDLRPTLSLWSSLFEQSKCAQRKVARIECSNFECGIRPVSSKLRRRIIGGQSSSFGSWPWQVALYREGDFQCGAVIIDQFWLLSAAHCFHSSPKAYWTARAGVLRRGSLLRSYHEEIQLIERIIIHPQYVDKGFVNDIALLKLKRPLRFSKYIRNICLPETEEDDVNNFQNQLGTTVGWGKLYEHGRIFPDTLQEVKLPIISSEECRKRTLFLPLYKITENMFCGGYREGGRDACLGDSGGPAMFQKSNGKWLLLGITSNGDGCGRANRPGVYTNVFNYRQWIDNTTTTYWPPTEAPKCEGHRCPLGKCLNSSQICNQVLDCPEDSSDELSCYY